jgi:type IV pilus assembly protein PilE
MIKKPKKNYGFTLIELLTALCIVAILSTIATVGYQSYIKRSRRAAAESVLLEMQLAEEKYRANHISYGDLDEIWGGVTTTEGDYYVLSITGISENTYSLIATGQHGQETDRANNTDCSVLRVNMHTGVDTRSPAECWK